MEHRLHVLVRLDIDKTSAHVEVSGGLSYNGCKSLFPVISRTRSLIDGLPVMVDFSHADHVDPSALEYVRRFAASQTWNAEQTRPQQRRQGAPVVVVAPKRLPYVTRDTGTTHTSGHQAPGSADRKGAAA